METESEPYVRLATLRTLHRIIAELNAARSLADTLQAVVEGAVNGLGFDAAAVNLVRPDGDLVVSAVFERTSGPLADYGDASGSSSVPADSSIGIGSILGQTGTRASWERLLSIGEQWGDLIFVPHERSWAWEPDIPKVVGGQSWSGDEHAWHPEDSLFAPMFSPGRELLGVLSVDRPRNGRRPGTWVREALEMFSLQASIAINNARLRAEMQRALARLEQEQQALRASEESFRQAFEYAPSGMAITELHGDQRSMLTRVNDALCRLLGRSRSSLRRQSFADLVHPEDRALLERTSAEGGRAELRLARRDGAYLWVSLRNSVVADASEGPRFLLTHVEDIEERKRHELQLAHRASHDALTGLPNGAELRNRLSLRLCARPDAPTGPAMRDFAAGGPGLGGTPGIAGASSSARHEGLEAWIAGDTPPRGHGYDLNAFDFDSSVGYDHVHAVPPNQQDPRNPGGRGRGLAVLFCDLDGFKSINDRFGHNAGDIVLIEVARRLQHAVREHDTVARLGGDEFVVLADGLDQEQAKDLAGRLRTAVVPPIRIEGRTVRVGVSMGIGWAGCGMSIDEVLHTADELMYVEKRSRSGGRSHRRAG
ncbi:diguanylate cyclase domain-containing protein [Phaeacidiphilus oryzae]|uniref:diguanylate cyclase domain-containing protein n=1 Tax=Phaeacidiphilus oryzae TaxID=348818 RepID=UPI00055BFB14|nr:diguanylate cyclase [Phaeacidiphilus oryzae]